MTIFASLAVEKQRLEVETPVLGDGEFPLRAAHLSRNHIGLGIYHLDSGDHQCLYIKAVHKRVGGEVQIECLSLKSTNGVFRTSNCLFKTEEDMVIPRRLILRAEDSVLITDEAITCPEARRSCTFVTRLRTGHTLHE